jgi:hypothetical protein
VQGGDKYLAKNTRTLCEKLGECEMSARGGRQGGTRKARKKGQAGREATSKTVDRSYIAASTSDNPGVLRDGRNAKEQMRGVTDENLEEVSKGPSGKGFGNFGDSGNRIN